jgi:hypothetical protein
MITLTTIIYEGNYKDVLNEESWFFRYNSEYITDKLIVVNNLDSIDDFTNLYSELKKNHDFRFIYVDNYLKDINEFFGLGISKSVKGYVYTAPYFVMILNVNTKYVLNVATDCMDDLLLEDSFFEDSLIELQNNEHCSTTMLPWIKNNKVTKHGHKIGAYEEKSYSLQELRGDNEKFNYTLGFTDQFFLANIDKLKKIDYNLPEKYSTTYKGPAYGGNSFEKRMVGHQSFTKTYNLIYNSNQYYIHDNKYFD